MNELKFRNLPDELRWGDKAFKLAMENRKAKLENLSEPEKSQKAREIAELEHCLIASAKESIDSAINKLKKY